MITDNKMNSSYFILFLVLILSVSCEVNSSTEIDAVMKNNASFISNKEIKINRLKEKCTSEINPEKKYKLYTPIIDEYIHFNADSALTYAIKKSKLLIYLQNKDTKEHYYDLARTAIHSGLMHKAYAYIEFYARHSVQKDKYYRLYIDFYESFTEFELSNTFEKEHQYLIQKYRDSLLTILPENSIDYRFHLCKKRLNEGKINEALQITEDVDSTLHSSAFQYLTARIYQAKNDPINYLKYLERSAIQNIKNSVRDNPALQDLAIYYDQNAEVKKAYKYMNFLYTQTLKGRIKVGNYKVWEYNKRLTNRSLELQNSKQSRMNILYSLLLFIGLLFVLGFFMVRRNAAKFKKINEELSMAYDKLIEQRSEIQKVNKKLLDQNNLQSKYFVRYLKLSSSYIKKIDDYRSHLFRSAKKTTKEEVLQLLKSKDIIDQELKIFYADFDKAFVALYPTFIQEYNRLLKKDQQIKTQKNSLNTELRIFALICLGISESNQIANFLRYSHSTIYNYRTKARNKAIGDRDSFEEQVKNIGKISAS